MTRQRGPREEHGAHPGQHRPGARHALGEDLVRDERPHHGDPGRPSDGQKDLHTPRRVGGERPSGRGEFDGLRRRGVRLTDHAPVRQEDGGGQRTLVHREDRRLEAGGVLGRAPGEDRDALGVLARGVERPVVRQRAGQEPERDQERQQHGGRHREPVEDEETSHAGGASFTPTPRTRWR